MSYIQTSWILGSSSGSVPIFYPSLYNHPDILAPGLQTCNQLKTFHSLPNLFATCLLLNPRYARPEKNKTQPSSRICMTRAKIIPVNWTTPDSPLRPGAMVRAQTGRQCNSGVLYVLLVVVVRCVYVQLVCIPEAPMFQRRACGRVND